MNIIGIDPGPRESAIVAITAGPHIGIRVLDGAPNHTAIDAALALCAGKPDLIACEWTINYGSSVGADVFLTAFACGVITECARRRGFEVKLISRPTVKSRITRSAAGDDNTVKRGLESILGKVGTPNKPGPLIALRGKESHVWAALAVAIAAGLGEHEIEERRQRTMEHAMQERSAL